MQEEVQTLAEQLSQALKQIGDLTDELDQMGRIMQRSSPFS